MKNILSKVLVFAAGAAVGSLVTWRVVKTAYERILADEIESIKDAFARLDEEDGDEYVTDEYEEEVREDDCATKRMPMTEYSSIVTKYKHPSDGKSDEEGDGDDPIASAINGPYVILPQDFGDGNYDHDLYCITYYADHVLADDWFVTMDIEETIGLEALDHFGDHAEDVVHVRNERLKADYEVVRDVRRYADLIAELPQVHAHEIRGSN